MCTADVYTVGLLAYRQRVLQKVDDQFDRYTGSGRMLENRVRPDGRRGSTLVSALVSRHGSRIRLSDSCCTSTAQKLQQNSI